MRELKIAVIIAFSLLISACGFSPIYGAHTNSAPVASELNQVAIDNIPDHEGQMVRNNLIDRMYGKGRPSTPFYNLVVRLRFQQEDLGIQADATSTRTLLNTYGDYTLFDMSEKTILTGVSHSVTSYNKLANQYGSLAASDSAKQRTLNEISEQIVNRISLYFAERAGTPPSSNLTK